MISYKQTKPYAASNSKLPNSNMTEEVGAGKP